MDIRGRASLAVRTTTVKALRWKGDGSIPETVSRGPYGTSAPNKKKKGHEIMAIRGASSFRVFWVTVTTLDFSQSDMEAIRELLAEDWHDLAYDFGAVWRLDCGGKGWKDGSKVFRSEATSLEVTVKRNKMVEAEGVESGWV